MKEAPVGVGLAVCLTDGEGHKSIKLPLLIQEVLGIEISRVGEELGVSQHATQHREDFGALAGRREGTFIRWSGGWVC